MEAFSSPTCMTFTICERPGGVFVVGDVQLSASVLLDDTLIAASTTSPVWRSWIRSALFLAGLPSTDDDVSCWCGRYGPLPERCAIRCAAWRRQNAAIPE